MTKVCPECKRPMDERAMEIMEKTEPKDKETKKETARESTIIRSKGKKRKMTSDTGYMIG